MPIYPLGPETPLLKMYEVIQPLYNEMAASPEPTPFWTMGDSAGGTMTLVLTQQAIEDGLPTASRIVPITPCVDSTLKNPDLHAAAKLDYWLDVPGLAEVTRLICPDVAAEDSRVSPTNGVVDDLPPMLLLAGSRDLFTPDVKIFVDKCKEQGSSEENAELFLGEGMLHVWPLIPIPEADEAMDKIVKWLQQEW